MFCVSTSFLVLTVSVTAQDPVLIPAGGNSWVYKNPSESKNVSIDGEIRNWRNPNDRIRTYFSIETPGKYQVLVRAKSAASTTIRFSLEGLQVERTIDYADFRDYSLGTVDFKRPGYRFLQMRGVRKTAETFADVAYIILKPQSLLTPRIIYLKDDFYFGRRGPSVHLRWQQPKEASEIKWFYNEIIVPKGQDVIGSYFMAAGFSGGYFGIQVNSPSTRKILFSVWSPYKTDDPKSIPEEFRVKLLKKGENVTVGEFGNEGSGGQSFRDFYWKTENRYRFLIKGEPAADGGTDYTAYFFAEEIGKWELIASFRRPKTQSYLTNLYSFLENFIPEYGDQTRKVFFDNQWMADVKGNWFEVTKAQFTADATARKGERLDYTGGVENGKFFLENCGFFDGETDMRIFFTRAALSKLPNVDLSSLE